WVKWFRDAVRPGTVTVVLLLGRLDQMLVLDELERFSGARLVYANVTSDFVQRIRNALDDPSTGPLTMDDPMDEGPIDGEPASPLHAGGPLPPPDPRPPGRCSRRARRAP